MFKIVFTVLFLFLSASVLISAQSDAENLKAEKSIKIKYYGQSAFGVTTSAGTKIIIDPANFKGYKMPEDITADIIAITHEHLDHNIINFDSSKSAIFHGTKPFSGKVNIIDTTISDVRLYSVNSFHDADGRRYNGIFVFEFDGIRLVHLGDIGTVLSDEQLEAIGRVDILMVPVGGFYTIAKAEADSIVNQLDVKQIVIPMHFKTEKFDGLPGTAEMYLEGKENVRRLNSNEMIVDLSKADVIREYVLLRY